LTVRISFFGLGYVGTVYSVGFASKGSQVIGFDIDKEKLTLLASGKSPFYEPGLSDLLKHCIKKNTFKVTSDPNEAVLNSDITFITVGTPSQKDGSIDLKNVIESSRMIGKTLKEKKGIYHVVVVKSTVIPGTTTTLIKDAIQCSSGLLAYNDFGLAMNPEFLKEGEAVQDFFKPDRVIIGSNDIRSCEVLEQLYSSFDCPKLYTDISSAELIKYANNSFLAMKVSFINMMANLCQKIPSSDISVVARGIGLDNRIGPSFLRAGAGWGGSCWPKDLNALMHFGKNLGVSLPLIDVALKINDSQPDRLVQLAEELLGNLKGKRIAVLGLSFKPNTDDVRAAVSLKIVRTLLEKGAKVIVYDPAAMENFKQALNNSRVKYASSAKSCIMGAECALIVTEWDEFKAIEPNDYLALMKYPALVDGRRIYEPMKYIKPLKFKAIGLGR
jgi:UDPglucose 6-dehydrogenase